MKAWTSSDDGKCYEIIRVETFICLKSSFLNSLSSSLVAAAKALAFPSSFTPSASSSVAASKPLEIKGRNKLTAECPIIVFSIAECYMDELPIYPCNFILPDVWLIYLSLDSLFFLLDIKSSKLNCNVKPTFEPEQTTGASVGGPEDCNGVHASRRS